MLRERAAAAGLEARVSTWEGRIEEYDRPRDRVVSLHACGGARMPTMPQVRSAPLRQAGSAVGAPRAAGARARHPFPGGQKGRVTARGRGRPASAPTS